MTFDHPLRSKEWPAVYVIEAGTSVKVGISNDPGRRAADMQTGQDRSVTVFWAIRVQRHNARMLEAKAHAALRRLSGHIRGEWFAVAPKTAVETIERLIRDNGLQSRMDVSFGWLGPVA